MLAIALLFLGFASQLPRIVVDTDPENMLPADQGARVLHENPLLNIPTPPQPPRTAR